MRKNLIIEVYGLLKSHNVVGSESEFSESWLGHSECYLRTLRYKKSEPSLGVVAICAGRLAAAADQLNAVPRYQRLGQQFKQMSDKCLAVVNADSVEFDLAA